MKKIVVVIFLLCSFVAAKAQVVDPVKWSPKIELKADNHFLITLNATIEPKWHLYSQFTPEGGSLPMEIKYKNQKGNFELVGKAKEYNTKTAYNDVFEVNELFFEKKAKIEQEIVLINSKLTTIEVNLDYQTCSDRCINLKKTFQLTIPSGKASKIEKNESIADLNKSVEPAKKIDSTSNKYSKVTTISSKIKVDSNPSKQEDKGLLTIFILAFFSGFAALLTPCVFPMIPMTVSFFIKQSKTKAAGIKAAIFYGFSIIAIYVVLGLVINFIFGADALNALATNPWFNIIFFILLIVFATSFLGAFEIMLPNSWANKVDKQADRGGVVGILFMALALAIVSFSCTGPIVGTLLVNAASKGGIAPIIGMLGFSTAVALPFMLFAMFPSWLNSLPKSGGWLNTVKVFLGFLELALAFKFLSNADSVLQTHFIEREVFLSIWIAIFGTLALYLFGKIKLPHDSPSSSISVGRLLLGLLVLTFTVYMIPGLWGAPLNLINAFPPPMEYSESPFGVDDVNQKTATVSSATKLPDGAKIGPHGITVFDDYDKGLAYAKMSNKPILLDFTGYACVNCRKMENTVWSDNQVETILKNEVVLISLFVDDHRLLPKNKQFVSKKTGAFIETIGDKWTDFMISTYKTNTQPLYVMTNLSGKNLNATTPTKSYDPNIDVYIAWLKEGISNFKK